MFHIDAKIPMLIAKMDHISIGGGDLNTKRGPTVPIVNRPKHRGYSNLVAQCIKVLLEYPQAECEIVQ